MHLGLTILQHKLAEAALAFRNTVAGLTHWQGTMKAVHFQSSEQHCVLRWMPSKECDVGFLLQRSQILLFAGDKNGG